MSDSLVLGMPLVTAEDDDTALAQPLAALVIVKAFDESSEVGVRHAVRSTAGLSTTEALGMARRAVLLLEKAIWQRGEDDDD